MNTNGNSFINGHAGNGNSLGTSSNSNSGELFDLKRFYSLIKRYIWVIILCAVLGTGLAYYLAYEYLLPVHRSESTLLISGSAEEFPGGSSEIGQIISSSYNLNANETVESEMQFIKSRELSEEVAEQIMIAKFLPDGTKYPLMWKDYPDDSSSIDKAQLAWRIRNGIKVERVEQKSNILVVSFESYSPYEAARIVNFSVNTYKEITAEKKRASGKSALAFLEEQKQDLKAKLDNAENQLSRFKDNQNLVSIESQTSNLVDALSSLESQKQNVAIQLEAVKSGIENHENQLEAIKPGLGDKYSQAAGPTISNYQQELAKLRTERLILVSNNPHLKDNPTSEPKMREIDRKINDISSEIKRLTDQLTSSNDNYLGLLAGTDGNVTQEITTIQTNLTELRIQKSQLEAQLQAIDNRLQSNEAFLNKVPQNQKQLRRLQREVQIFEELFLIVSKQASEVSLWEQTRTGAGTVIDHAQVRKSPVKPRKMVWLALGMLAGMMLPVGFIVTKEVLNKRINSIQDLDQGDHPLLAVIYQHSLLNKKKADLITPSSHKKSKKISEDLILYHYGLSPIAESYRNLVSKILYSNPDNPPQTLLITSPGAGEGKTTLTANMATALTEVGKRVLIIDCDMRKPGIPNFFGIPKDPGIMEVLFKDYPVQEVIKNVPIPGIDIFTTGKKLPARPNSVIGSQSFKKLIERFKLEYDFILLDSAPFGIIGDVAPILQYTDGVILNTKFDYTTYIQLHHTLNELEKNSALVMGIVLNGYDPKKSVDNVEVKNLYNNMYTSYYDYHETKKKTKRKKYKRGKFV